ncbi:hypothetical protein ASPBRDRAFT_201794 [Aspergillus brasiliensis CBS 101740]|uniref:GPI inositol-deacylase n=1 Tax=Aspergillus brasiliensis (strain CBS 101740 / IMI 381727 / IBT 21946) TaxID=767769 RepID=A0A1L9U1D9_ASPBC|nr:hypothetical protein ASPBRDRAFT_201794 [Aspergillus brasiliensis CBS 101740]
MDQKPIERLGFSKISGSSDAYVDIVFVHGLWGHAKETWTKTASERSVFWPLDLLSENPGLEQARILTWGYDTRISWLPFRAMNQQDITSHANDLMVALQAERSKDRSRPLIFVCHSLGGILVKIVLDKSRWPSSQNTQIYRSTRGIIFLGTPHHGSEAANWADIASNLAKFSNPGFNSSVLQGLRLNSQLLDNVHERFRYMLDEGQFGIHSFGETMPVVRLFGRTVVVPEKSAMVGHKREKWRNIAGNHLEICKFDETTNDGYKAVLEAILEYIREIEVSGPQHENCCITAVSRAPSHLDVFACGNDGQVYTSWWIRGSGWQDTKWKNLGGDFSPGAKVSAVARHSEHLDLFMCDANGCVKTAWWSSEVPGWSSLRGWVPARAQIYLYNGLASTEQIGKRFLAWGSGEEPGLSGLEGWVAWGQRLLPSGLVSTDWEQIGEGFPAGADVAAVACKEDRLDLFVCGNDGKVYTTSWTKDSGWEDRWKPLNGHFSPGAKITAVAQPHPHYEQIDLFICGADGSVKTSRRNGDPEWTNWQLVGPEQMFPGEADVTAVAREEGYLDLFVCGNDGKVYTTSWTKDSGWEDRWISLNGYFPPGAKIEAVARHSEKIELFVCDDSGNVKTSHRNGSLKWTNWQLVGAGFTEVADVTAVSRTEEQNLDLFVCGSREQEEYGFWWIRWGKVRWDRWHLIGKQSLLQ